MTTLPPFPRRALGDTIRRLREQKRWSISRAATEFNVSRSKVREIEGGSTKVSLLEVAGLCRLYGAPDEVERELVALALASDADQPNWMERLDEGIPHWARKFVAMEQRASSMLIYENELVTGIFQTEAYIRHLMAVCDWLDEAEVEKIVQARLMRGQAYAELDDPPETTLILSEQSLRRVVGSRQTMDEQIERLLEADKNVHVRISVLPFSAGAHPSMAGPYTVLDFDSNEPSIVYIESRDGCRYEDHSVTISQYRRDFDASLRRTMSIKEFVNDSVAQIQPQQPVRWPMR